MATFTSLRFPVELPVVKKGEHWIARAGDRELKLSRLDKMYWPKEGITKGDLLTYYFNVSPWMLPHIADRPLTLKRMPDGIEGDYFYEKNAPGYTPKWMPTIPVRTSEDDKTITYLTVTDVTHMLWLANLGCIEFHPLHARGTDQKHPDYAFFDLDPMSPGIWDQVKYVASLIKVILDKLGLASYPKTSGATGMQIYIPIEKRYEYDIIRGFVGAIAEMVHAAEPEATTLEWETKKRGGKVFIDVNMNREGANIAAAYSVRPEPGATVSTPFTWDELEDVRPEDWGMETIFPRLEDKGDPFLPVAGDHHQNLDDAIRKLEARPRKARLIRGR